MLATFNGERYLPEQLRSLAAQTCQDFVLLVRDDGSADRTLAIVEEFRAEFADRLVVLPPGGQGAGACRSFALLLSAALESDKNFDYFAFCDQDDIWRPEKLARLAGIVREAEQRGADQAVLAHCDMRIVDDEGAETHPSFWRNQGFNPAEVDLGALAFVNTVTGNACLFNRRLAEYAAPVPETALMHDWWLALVAAATGRVLVEDTALVDYRQHGANALGAREVGWRRFLRLSHWLERVLDFSGSARQQVAQMESLVARFKSLDPRLDAWEGLRGVSGDSWLRRRWRVIRLRFLPRPWARRLDFLLKL